MKRPTKKLLPHLAAAAFTLAFFFPGLRAQEVPRAKPESVGMSTQRLNRLSEAFDGYAASGRLAGGVVMVARKGKLVYSRAFGSRDKEANAPMTEDTIFRIASQSKALTSVGIMILQEEGKLLITDPVSKYLPDFANSTVAVPKAEGGYDVVKAKKQITIRDLLTHTAGIGYGEGVAKDKWVEAGVTGWYLSDRDESIQETVAKIAKLPMDAHPGEKWVYGYSSDILGAVIERASGQTFDVFLTKRIFEPLGMADTAFYLPESETGRLAAVYSAKGNGIERAPDPGRGVGQGAYVKGPRKNFSGGAGLLSTAGDYLRFLQMLLNLGETERTMLLSRKSVELMTADHLQGISFRDGQGFGLGFSIVTDLGARGTIGSEGEIAWGGAYHSTYWIDPQEGLVVVYFTQLIPAGTVDDFGKLRSLVYQAIID